MHYKAILLSIFLFGTQVYAYDRNVRPIGRYYGGGAYHSQTIIVGGGNVSSSSGCVTVLRNGVTYRECGQATYQPVFVGDQLTQRRVEPRR